jgi:hypothetical protein
MEHARPITESQRLRKTSGVQSHRQTDRCSIACFQQSLHGSWVQAHPIAFNRTEMDGPVFTRNERTNCSHDLAQTYQFVTSLEQAAKIEPVRLANEDARNIHNTGGREDGLLQFIVYDDSCGSSASLEWGSYAWLPDDKPNVFFCRPNRTTCSFSDVAYLSRPSHQPAERCKKMYRGPTQNIAAIGSSRKPTN